MFTRHIILAALLGVSAGATQAEVVSPSAVVANEYGEIAQSLTGIAGDPARGQEVMTTRGLGNCIACHQVTALQEYPFHGEVGPELDGVGDRWTSSELRGILSNAKITFDGTVMPAYYKVDGFIRPGNAYTGKAADGALSPLLSAQDIEDVVAFLSTLKE